MTDLPLSYVLVLDGSLLGGATVIAVVVVRAVLMAAIHGMRRWH